MPISGAEISIATRVAGAVRRLFRRPDPVALLKRRAQVKEEMRRNLYAKDANWGDPPEVIVVKLGKHDKYPKTDTRRFPRGASDWFKAEVKDLHDRGLEVYSAIEHVVIKNGKARRVGDEVSDARKVWVVGRIPYERVAHMDWEPDPGYFAPRFYVVYTWIRRRVFKEIALYEQGRFGSDDYMYEIQDVNYVGEGGGLIGQLGRQIEGAKVRRKIRRHEKAWRNRGT